MGQPAPLGTRRLPLLAFLSSSRAAGAQRLAGLRVSAASPVSPDYQRGIGPRSASWRSTLALAAAVLAFYLCSLAPSLVWADGARLQLDVMLSGSHYLYLEELEGIATDDGPFSRLGIAPWDHPLYVMAGRAFSSLPWGNPPFLLNLMSALAAAVTVGLVYRVGFALTGVRVAAAAGAVAVAVSHTFWFHAVTTEVYALHSLFMISILALLLPVPGGRSHTNESVAAFLAGLGMANHVMLVLLVLPVVAYRMIVSKGGRWLGLVLLFLAGFSPWLIQFVRMARAVGTPLAVQFALFYPKLPGMVFEQGAATIVENFASYAGMLLYQFTPVGVALGAYGVAQAIRGGSGKGGARLLVVLLAVHVLFSANYPVADRFAFHQPSYVLFGLFIVYGMAATLPRIRQPIGRALLLATVLMPIALYAATPSVLGALGVTSADLGLHPIGTGARDGIRYFLNPNKRGDDSAAQFGRSTLTAVGPRALILSARPGDRETYLVLRYVQAVEKLRPDVHIELFGFTPEREIGDAVLAYARALSGCRPIYLASLNDALYPLADIRAEFDIHAEANLFRLRARDPAGARSTCSDLPDLRGNRDARELMMGAFE